MYRDLRRWLALRCGTVIRNKWNVFSLVANTLTAQRVLVYFRLLVGIGARLAWIMVTGLECPFRLRARAQWSLFVPGVVDMTGSLGLAVTWSLFNSIGYCNM